jgi:hypothetical protein
MGNIIRKLAAILLLKNLSVKIYEPLERLFARAVGARFFGGM